MLLHNIYTLLKEIKHMSQTLEDQVAALTAVIADIDTKITALAAAPAPTATLSTADEATLQTILTTVQAISAQFQPSPAPAPVAPASA